MHLPVLPSRAALALIAASAIALPLLTARVAPAAAQPSVGFAVSFGYFQDRLGRYGAWLHHPRWGEVWLPHGGQGFRPYYDGHWEYTFEDGWLWVSEDPWGEITDHYGRWVFDPGYGWLWVPGYVWGPSWVVWREANGYIGWFPMPPDYDDFDPYYYGPRYGADAWYGYRAWYPGFADTSFFSLWVFVDNRDFGYPGRRRYTVDPFRIRDVYRSSVERTHYVDDHNHIVDRAIDVRRLEQETHRRIEAQPARRFFANVPTTSITEGRDIARRNRDAIRGNAPAINFGNGNQGRGNFGGGNTGGGNLGAGNPAPGNFGGPGANPANGRGQNQARPFGNDQGRGFGRGFPGDDHRNDNVQNHGPALTNIPVPQIVPQPNGATGPAQLPGAARGDNRPQTGGAQGGGAPQGRGSRSGGAQVEGQSRDHGADNAPAPHAPVQAQAAPVPAPQTQAVAPPRGGQGNADRDDQRRGGRDRGRPD